MATVTAVDSTCVLQDVPDDIEKSQPGKEQPESLKAPYSVFSSLQKKSIVALVCFAGVISPLSSLLYTPAIPAIAADLDTSVQAINLSVTTFLIFQGLTPSLWGTLGDIHGRRPLYIITSLVSAGACIGLSITNSYPALLVLRALQAAGSTSTRALGAGVIRDLIPPHIRGGYMGAYSAGVGIGTAFGPLLGGILAQYTGWHGIFYFLLGLSTTSMLSIALLLPETLQYVVGNGSKRPPRYSIPPIRWLCPTSSWRADDGIDLPPRPKVDVLGPLRLLTHIDVLCCVTFTGICYTVWQDSMIATSTLYSSRYGLSEAKIGLTYLSNGFGSLIGNIVTGRLLDHDYKKQLTKEQSAEGSPTPGRVDMIEKARLISLRIDAPIFIIGILAFGWVIQSHTSIAASVTIAFFIGWFDSGILTTYSTLMVDLFESQASASSAIINLVRCLLGAVGTSTVEPMIQKLGVGWSFTLLAGICTIALPLVVMHYYYGHGWRQKRISKVSGRLGNRVENEAPDNEPTPSQVMTLPTYSFVDHHIATTQVLCQLVNNSAETTIPLSYMLFPLFVESYKTVFGNHSKIHFKDSLDIGLVESTTHGFSQITREIGNSRSLEQLSKHDSSELLFSYLVDLGPMIVREVRLTTEWQFAKLDDGLHVRVYFIEGDSLTKEKILQACVLLVEKVEGLSVNC